MFNLQNIVMLFGLFYSLSAFILALNNRKNPFGLTPQFGLIGAFVWVDAVVFGLFFTFVSVISLLLNDFMLFLLVFSVFWTVRTIGEQVYWFLEQFAPSHRNPPHTLWPARYFKWLFKGQEVWIVMQIVLQCISVISIISSVYLFSIWIK